jgi:alkanesulfonate monooxygenase SsuD/methylene tetrahydromethanopterin reductase-like flavin-dependent oxidoreductase (luciferase family)
LLGGNGPRTLERVVRFADEWMPNAFGAEPFGARISELERLAAEAGRDRIAVTAFGCRPDAEGVARYASIGVDRCVFWVPFDSRDAALRSFDELRGVVAKFTD